MIDVDNYLLINGKEAIDRAKRYPYRLATSSYTFFRGEKLNKIPDHFSLNKRIPVIAYGANSSIESLIRKYKNITDSWDDEIPVIKCQIVGYSILLSSQISSFGFFPLTIAPSKDSIVNTFIIFLTSNQLKRMHFTENLNCCYSFNKINTEVVTDNGMVLDHFYSYVSIKGALKINNKRITLKNINHNFENTLNMTQIEAIQLIIEKLNLSITYQDFITQNIDCDILKKNRNKLIENSFSEKIFI
jgi:hypothetical protein